MCVLIKELVINISYYWKVCVNYILMGFFCWFVFLVVLCIPLNYNLFVFIQDSHDWAFYFIWNFFLYFVYHSFVGYHILEAVLTVKFKNVFQLMMIVLVFLGSAVYISHCGLLEFGIFCFRIFCPSEFPLIIRCYCNEFCSFICNLWFFSFVVFNIFLYSV